MTAKILENVSGYEYIVLQVSEGENEIVQADLCTSMDDVYKVLIDRIREEIEFIMYNTWDSVEQFQEEEPDFYNELIYINDSLDMMDMDELFETWNKLFADHWLFKVISIYDLHDVAYRA